MVIVAERLPENGASGWSLDDDRFGEHLINLLPFLRNYAAKLCGDATQAQDLAQEAVTRGWMARSRFLPGTNLKAWLLTILRNYHFSQYRKYRHYCALEKHDAEVPGEETAGAAIELAQVRHALDAMSASERKLLLALGEGQSYREIAARLGCPIGTVKSRVSRSRAALRQMLLSVPHSAAPMRMGAAHRP